MATSTKVQFNLESLRAKALETINLRIDQKHQEVLSYEDETVLQERIQEWRTRQEKRLHDVVSLLPDMGDHQLAKFKLEPIPDSDPYERRKAIRELRSLEEERSRIEAKSSSLVPDADGNISLTSTQMQEFFGL